MVEPQEPKLNTNDHDYYLNARKPNFKVSRENCIKYSKLFRKLEKNNLARVLNKPTMQNPFYDSGGKVNDVKNWYYDFINDFNFVKTVLPDERADPVIKEKPRRVEQIIVEPYVYNTKKQNSII